MIRRLIVGVLLGIVLIVWMIRDARASTCTPAIDDIRIGVTSDGGWAYWWCVKDGKLVYDSRTIATADLTPDMVSALRSYSEGKNPGLTGLPGGSATGPAYTALHAAVLAAAIADPNKPVISSWVVAKNGASLTRPAFPVINGKRSFSSDGTVAVGSPCSDAIKLIEGSLTFLQVSAGHVAVCSIPTP